LSTSERSEANRDTPVFMAHGLRDPVVPVARAIASRDALQALGQPVRWHEYPIEHTVSIEELRDLERWLLERLA
jgi:phospholipase/carboxylesterase